MLVGQYESPCLSLIFSGQPRPARDAHESERKKGKQELEGVPLEGGHVIPLLSLLEQNAAIRSVIMPDFLSPTIQRDWTNSA